MTSCWAFWKASDYADYKPGPSASTPFFLTSSRHNREVGMLPVGLNRVAVFGGANFPIESDKPWLPFFVPSS